ncbi:MAG: 2-dehydropantoate 2-reductase [Flavobacteriales bacterium]|nr:2-dehydropantoate 2-reductase [Flavobacteriales bacterium]
MKKTKILIAGIGGVGGFFGGKLAAFYKSNPEVEISFLVRGPHLEKIREKGLEVRTTTGTLMAHPFHAGDQFDSSHRFDFIFIACKSYDLEKVLHDISNNLHSNTVIIPLLNGIDHHEKINHQFPNHAVADACVYIVARKIAPGIIENSGNIQKLFFGFPQKEDERLHLLFQLLVQSEIEANLTTEIQSTVWEKYIFLSPIACITSCYDRTIGEVLAQEDSYTDLLSLLDEILQLANFKQIHIHPELRMKTIEKWKSLPYSSTSSMHSDFKANSSRTELESLCVYVLKELQQYKPAEWNYGKIARILKEKSMDATGLN